MSLKKEPIILFMTRGVNKANAITCFTAKSDLKPNHNHMDNINFICGKTADGRKITLDGFRVESSTWSETDEGDKCNDLVFKSGQEIRVLSDSFDGDIDAQLFDCIGSELNTNYADDPVIFATREDGKDIQFDGTAVEFYIAFKNSDGEALVELHFASGRTIVVFDEVDEDEYPGECVQTLVDDCICRYFEEED